MKKQRNGTSATGEKLLKEYAAMLELQPTKYGLIASIVGTVLPMIGSFKMGDVNKTAKDE
jgi:hypothetical protein